MTIAATCPAESTSYVRVCRNENATPTGDAVWCGCETGCLNNGQPLVRPAPEPMSRYGVGYLTGFRSGVGYAISAIEPLVVGDPESTVFAIREALRVLAEQVYLPKNQR